MQMPRLPQADRNGSDESELARHDSSVFSCLAVFSEFDHMDIRPSLLEATPTRRSKPVHHPPPRAVDRFPPGSHRVLSTLGLVVITYCASCGGPMGSEPVVKAAGPLLGLMSLVVYPLVVMLPMARIVTELCTAFPEDGGFVVWALNAFGPFWAFQIGYWSWLGGVFRGALVPGVVLQLVSAYFHFEIPSPVITYLLKAALAVALSFPSLFGTRCVKRSCLLLVTLSLASMLLIAGWGYSVTQDPTRLIETKHTTRNRSTSSSSSSSSSSHESSSFDWALLINTLMWRFDGIHMASVFGGEVAHTTHVYPRAVTLTATLTVLSYLLPLPAALIAKGSSRADDAFTFASYPTLASAIGGRVLQKLTAVGTVSGLLALFLATVFAQSFQVCGMAESQLLPNVLANRNIRFDSPHLAIVGTVIATLMLLGMSVGHLIPVANAFSGAVQLLLVASAIRLRLFLPFIPRPSKTPGGVGTMAAVAVLIALAWGYVMVDALQTLPSALLISLLTVPGVAYGAYQQHRSDCEASPVMFA